MDEQVIIIVLKVLEEIRENLSDVVNELKGINNSILNIEYDLESKWK